ncbi:MAG: GrdX family protein [Synergistaceae bacterium]|nr:GrdX family protein [Synergistaceae bacterium]
MLRLITNNAGLHDSAKSSEYVDGSSLDVLIHVRGLVHSGSIILTHPLCGNLRPNHQPYRSVIVDVIPGAVDLDSLSVIESAVNVYQSAEIITPKSLDALTRADYAYIDAELMRESLGRYGLIRDERLCDAPSLRVKEV